MASRRGLKKAFRKHLGRVAKIGMVVLPIAGAIVAGPAGAAAGTAIAAGGARYGGAAEARAKGKKGREARTAGRRRMKQAAIVGGVITGGALAVAAVGGTGLATGVISTIGQMATQRPGGGGKVNDTYQTTEFEHLNMPADSGMVRPEVNTPTGEGGSFFDKVIGGALDFAKDKYGQVPGTPPTTQNGKPEIPGTPGGGGGGAGFFEDPIGPDGEPVGWSTGKKIALGLGVGVVGLYVWKRKKTG